jgi:hypothetical protein
MRTNVVAAAIQIRRNPSSVQAAATLFLNPALAVMNLYDSRRVFATHAALILTTRWLTAKRR